MSGAEYMLLGDRPVSDNDLKDAKGFIIKVVLLLVMASALSFAYAYLI